jgi:hypothetical protein
LNAWGGSAGKVTEWTGSAWSITQPSDLQVLTSNADTYKYQYDAVSNTWSRNDWGGFANQLAQWTGSAWSYTVPVANDIVVVTDESLTYQYVSGSWYTFLYWVEVVNPSGSVTLS